MLVSWRKILRQKKFPNETFIPRLEFTSPAFLFLIWNKQMPAGLTCFEKNNIFENWFLYSDNMGSLTYFTPLNGRNICIRHSTKMKFSIKDFFSKCNQIRSFLQIWSHLLKKSLMENFIFSCCETTNFMVYEMG